MHHHFPETLTASKPLDILEFSTAHGAMLEVWHHFGHNVRGMDFAGWPDNYNKMAKRPPLLDRALDTSHDNLRAPKNLGWIYQPIIESLGLTVDLFDAEALPYAYAYANKSFDVICCYQAIEAYPSPERWMDILDEFCRIARKSIVIGFNPPARLLRDDEAHMAQVRAATNQLRCYNRNGFQSVFLEFGETNAGFHPTAVKLVAKS